MTGLAVVVRRRILLEVSVVNVIKQVLLKLAQWIVDWATPPPPPPPSLDVRVMAAVAEAYRKCGLPLQHFSMEFDLLQAGKLQEVLYKAGLLLDHDQSFRTVGDVVSVLSHKGE